MPEDRKIVFEAYLRGIPNLLRERISIEGMISDYFSQNIWKNENDR